MRKLQAKGTGAAVTTGLILSLSIGCTCLWGSAMQDTKTIHELFPSSGPVVRADYSGLLDLVVDESVRLEVARRMPVVIKALMNASPSQVYYILVFLARIGPRAAPVVPYILAIAETEAAQPPKSLGLIPVAWRSLNIIDPDWAIEYLPSASLRQRLKLLGLE